MIENIQLFPFAEYWWLYASFLLGVVAMLLLDLGVFHKRPHEVTIKEAITWTIVWVSLAAIFNIFLYLYSSHSFALNPRLTSIAGFDALQAAKQVSIEFLTGFTIEKALAIDNVFVFVVVFRFFAIPAIYQHRILFYGIIGALVFRGAFIALGSQLMAIDWVVLLAGIFLILTGIKIFFAPEKQSDLSNNFLVKFLKKIMPVTDQLEGSKFIVSKNGKMFATPLLLALIVIEFSDIIFAIDSVPAIFAVTKEPFIVFTSNIFAILGLRSLYFLLAGIMDRFAYLKYGLGLILIFVGLKMAWLNEAFGGKFPVSWSLGIIGAILSITIATSLLKSSPNKKSEGN